MRGRQSFGFHLCRRTAPRRARCNRARLGAGARPLHVAASPSSSAFAPRSCRTTCGRAAFEVEGDEATSETAVRYKRECSAVASPVLISIVSLGRGGADAEGQRRVQGRPETGNPRSGGPAVSAAKASIRTSLPDIFAESGLSPGAVYRYFPSKDDIIAALADERHAAEAELFAQATDGKVRRRSAEKRPRALGLLGCAIRRSARGGASVSRYGPESLRNPRVAKLMKRGIDGRKAVADASERGARG